MSKIIHILFIDEVAEDQLEIKRILQKRHIPHRFTVVSNYKQVTDFIASALEKPDLVLLDTEAVEGNGTEVLAMLTSDPEWKEVKTFLVKERHVNESHAIVVPGVAGVLSRPLKLGSPSSPGAFHLMIDLLNF